MALFSIVHRLPTFTFTSMSAVRMADNNMHWFWPPALSGKCTCSPADYGFSQLQNWRWTEHWQIIHLPAHGFLMEPSVIFFFFMPFMQCVFCVIWHEFKTIRELFLDWAHGPGAYTYINWLDNRITHFSFIPKWRNMTLSAGCMKTKILYNFKIKKMKYGPDSESDHSNISGTCYVQRGQRDNHFMNWTFERVEKCFMYGNKFIASEYKKKKEEINIFFIPCLTIFPIFPFLILSFHLDGSDYNNNNWIVTKQH